jgi:hypothetical protein
MTDDEWTLDDYMRKAAARMEKRASRIGKADLIELIRLGYPAGIGPRVIAKLTGYHRDTIGRYAAAIGVECATTRPKPPAEYPIEFMIAMTRAGLSRHTLAASLSS